MVLTTPAARRLPNGSFPLNVFESNHAKVPGQTILAAFDAAKDVNMNDQ